MSKTYRREPLRKQREGNRPHNFGRASMAALLLQEEEGKLRRKHEPDTEGKQAQMDYMWELRTVQRLAARMR